MPSHRIRRVNEAVREVLAELLQDLKDPRIGFVTLTDVLARRTTWTYNALGQLTDHRDALNRQSTYVYDTRGNLIMTRNAQNNATNYEYNARGQLTLVTDPLSRTTTFTFNELHQNTVITQPDPDGGGALVSPVTTFTYDAEGQNLTIKDPLSRITTFTWNNRGWMATQTDASGSVSTFLYDAVGNRTGTQDSGGSVGWTYDALDRLTNVAFADSSSTAYAWDAENRLTQVTDSVAGTITRSYDVLDHLIQEATPEGTVNYTYDAAGRRVTMTVTGQPTVTYGYDNADRLVLITQANAVVSLTYDAAGRLATSTNALGGTFASSLHCPQIRRASRWAVISSTLAAMLNGATPMFSMRVRVVGASLVCSVDITRWPVIAALIATSAVSKSRISPTRMMLGSWRRKERSEVAKLSPICSFICTWLMPARLNSTGSSAVMMLTSGVLMRCSAE